jgi:hypothetical protein
VNKVIWVFVAVPIALAQAAQDAFRRRHIPRHVPLYSAPVSDWRTELPSEREWQTFEKEVNGAL